MYLCSVYFVNNAHSYSEATQGALDKQVAFVAEKALESVKYYVATKRSEIKFSPFSISEMSEPGQIELF